MRASVVRLALLILFIGSASLFGAASDLKAVQELAACERAAQLDPASESKRFGLASLYLSLDQSRKAVETLDNYLATHPDSLQSLRLLATAHLRAENYQSARTTADRAVKLSPRDASGIYLLGMAELGLQNSTEAERLFVESLGLNPDSAESNFQLGLLYAQRHENLDKAVQLLEKASSLQKNSAGIYTALGSALFQRGKPDEAQRALQTALRLDPKSSESWYLLADLYRSIHVDDKAQYALQQFSSLSASNADLREREMRSRALYEEGVVVLTDSDDFDKARDLFAKAIAELPTLDAAHYRQAQVAYLKRDLPLALISIREALRLNPIEPEYHFVLAKCLEKTDPAAALVSVRTAVDLHPGVTDFEDLLHELEKGTTRK